MLIAFLILGVRAATTQLTLTYQTNNVSHWENLTALSIERREFGSKMVLVVRICYSIFIWCMKFAVLAFYSRLVEGLEKYRRLVKPIWALLAATLVASLVSTLAECRPFEK